MEAIEAHSERHIEGEEREEGAPRLAHDACIVITW